MEKTEDYDEDEEEEEESVPSSQMPKSSSRKSMSSMGDKNRNIKNILLYVAKGDKNERAIAYYERLGFKQIKILWSTHINNTCLNVLHKMKIV